MSIAVRNCSRPGPRGVLTVEEVLAPAQVEQLKQIQVLELAVAGAGVVCEDELHTTPIGLCTGSTSKGELATL